MYVTGTFSRQIGITCHEARHSILTGLEIHKILRILKFVLIFDLFYFNVLLILLDALSTPVEISSSCINFKSLKLLIKFNE